MIDLQGQNVLMVPAFGPESPEFQAVLKRRDAIMTKAMEILHARMASGGNLQGRDATLTLADLISAGGGYGLGDATWYGLSTKLSMDHNVVQELKAITFQRVPPGGRRLDFLTYPRNMLRATGVPLSSINDEGAEADAKLKGSTPTVKAKQCSPVSTFAYTRIPVDAARAMILNWDAENQDQMDIVKSSMSADFGIKMAFLLSAQASMMNLFWNGNDPAGTAGLDHYDGMLVQAEANLAAGNKVDTTGKTDILIILKDGWTAQAAANPAMVKRPDLMVATSDEWREALIEQALSDATDRRCTYVVETNTLKYRHAIVQSFTDLQGRYAFLGPKAAFFLGIIDNKPKVQIDWQLNGQYYELAVEVQNHGVLNAAAGTEATFMRDAP